MSDQGDFYAFRQLKFEYLLHTHTHTHTHTHPNIFGISCVRLSHVWTTKTSLAWTKIASDEEVKYTVYKWLWSQLETFFTDGIRSFINCYTVCIKKRGNCVEKWNTLRLSRIVVHKVINEFITFMYVPCVLFNLLSRPTNALHIYIYIWTLYINCKYYCIFQSICFICKELYPSALLKLWKSLRS